MGVWGLQLFICGNHRPGEAASDNGMDHPLDHQSNYPTRRVLHLTTYGPPQGAVRDFSKWLLSDEGREVINKRFVPVGSHPCLGTEGEEGTPLGKLFPAGF